MIGDIGRLFSLAHTRVKVVVEALRTPKLTCLNFLEARVRRHLVIEAIDCLAEGVLESNDQLSRGGRWNLQGLLLILRTAVLEIS